MDQLDTLNERISFKKKKIIVDIERNKKLLLFSYFLITVLFILVFYFYNKYSKLLDQMNQIENNTNQKFKEIETHSERIKGIIEIMKDFADHADKQNVYNHHEIFQDFYKLLSKEVKECQEIIDKNTEKIFEKKNNFRKKKE